MTRTRTYSTEIKSKRIFARSLVVGDTVLLISDDKNDDPSGKIPFEIVKVSKKNDELMLGAVGRDGSYHGYGRYDFHLYAWKVI